MRGAGRLTGVANKKSDASDISRFEYTLDGAGVRRTMAISGSAYTSASVDYLYDDAYQLTKETRTGGSAYTQTFWYDDAGNRTKSDLGGNQTVYYCDYIDRMTKYGATALEWDAWGNMTKVGTHGYYYDDADRLTKYDYSSGTSNDSTFHYLPGSWQRYKRVQDTTAEYFLYDGANVVDSYASGGTLNARYVTPGLDENLSMTRSGSVYYYMADGLGSVRNIIEADEDVANTYDYYAFGNALGTPTEGVVNPFEYTGRDFEDGGVNGTYYYRNRYYMSSLGIFTSRDAMWADVHRGWGYVQNLPTVLSDSWGLGPARGQGSWRGYVDPALNDEPGASADFGFKLPSGACCDQVEFIQISKLNDDPWLSPLDEIHDWQIDSPTGSFWYVNSVSVTELPNCG